MDAIRNYFQYRDELFAFFKTPDLGYPLMDSRNMFWRIDKENNLLTYAETEEELRAGSGMYYREKLIATISHGDYTLAKTDPHLVFLYHILLIDNMR